MRTSLFWNYHSRDNLPKSYCGQLPVKGSNQYCGTKSAEDPIGHPVRFSPEGVARSLCIKVSFSPHCPLRLTRIGWLSKAAA